MKKIQSLPKGSPSESGKYWCVTCKKLFKLDKPICPYMTKMCVNTPIAVENLNPESTVGIENFGLFYPKIPQLLFAELASGDYEKLGGRLAKTYLSFVEEWKINYKASKLQTMKSFIIILTGCETAQRVDSEEVTFVVMDPDKIWAQEKLFPILRGGVKQLKKDLSMKHRFKFDSISIFGNRDMGKYFCPMCRKFFEFGIKREKVTCPLMSQKCMVEPSHIEVLSNYHTDDLIKVYKVTPNIHKRFNALLEKKEKGEEVLGRILKEEWEFDYSDDELETLAELLGV